MALEIERKYLDADLALCAEHLRDLGAFSEGWHFETNLVFDSPQANLLAEKHLLRLRKRQWRDRVLSSLTFKTPVATEACDFKIREELQTDVGDFEIMAAILASLGFTPVATYEKARESWKVSRAPGGRPFILKVDLDILPFCHCVEIEGDPGAGADLAMALGLDKLEISAKSYHDLHQQWLMARGLESAIGFVFEESAKKELLNGLGI